MKYWVLKRQTIIIRELKNGLSGLDRRKEKVRLVIKKLKSFKKLSFNPPNNCRLAKTSQTD